VAAWRLPSEPWTFVIDRTGRISQRFEGAVSPGELERAVAKVAS
jgi:glutathione peroxidase-family protein